MIHLPNILTMSRIFLTVVFIVYLHQGGLLGMMIAVLAFTAASLSDYYDGYFARKYQLDSSFGKIMDPIADKFLMLSAFFIFAKMHLFAWWMFWVICLREVLVTLSRLVAMNKGEVIAAEKYGKYKTVLQIVAISVILIYLLLIETPWRQNLVLNYVNVWIAFITMVMYLTVLLTLYSGITYYWNNRKALHA